MGPTKRPAREGDRLLQQGSLSAVLLEKWNQFKKDREEVRANFQKYHMNKLRHVMQALFLFVGGTLMYSVHVLLVPYVFGTYDGWTRYYIKVVLTYIGVMTTANWLCAILNDSSVPVTRDRPHLNGVRCSSGRDYFTGRLSYEDAAAGERQVSGEEKDGGLPWTVCKFCDRQAPPRSRHCRHCGTCVLKRDHHCFMLGTCVGFRNQRFFIVFLCYMVACCVVGLPCIVVYVRGHFPDLSYSDLFLPLTLYRTLFGDLDPILALMVLHGTFMTTYFPLACFQLLTQVSLLLDGRTPHEIAKKIPVRDTLTLRKRTESVFGSFWQLNFLFPAQLFFRQPGDGMSWPGVKLDSSRQAVDEV